MKNLTIKPFHIIGISVRTSNENGEAAKDIPELWQTFMNQGIINNIPNKINSSIYSIYTDYESDHTKPYTTILGCKVETLDDIPDGMIGKSFKGGNYVKFIAKGDISKGQAVYDTWIKIWQQDLDRVYTADFEIYGEKAQNPLDAEVEILIAIK
jgi:predicted transcriptional regulator YdeE